MLTELLLFWFLHKALNISHSVLLPCKHVFMFDGTSWNMTDCSYTQGIITLFFCLFICLSVRWLPHTYNYWKWRISWSIWKLIFKLARYVFSFLVIVFVGLNGTEGLLCGGCGIRVYQKIYAKKCSRLWNKNLNDLEEDIPSHSVHAKSDKSGMRGHTHSTLH